MGTQVSIYLSTTVRLLATVCLAWMEAQLKFASCLHLTSLTVFFLKNVENGAAESISVLNDSTVYVSRTVFESNKAVSTGGAINLQDGAAFICSDSLFSNNTTGTEVVTLLNYGGAIKGGTNSTLHVRRINFTENTASTSGGAIFMSDSKSVKISESSFNKNVGSACSFLQSVNVNITDSQFHNNWTPLDGGAINAFVSEAALRNVSFIENTAKGNGGSVYFVVNSILTFYKCIFSKNNALYQGGGIWSLNSKLVIKHSDFY